MWGRKGDEPQPPAWTPGVDEEAMADDPSFVWEPDECDDE